MEKSRFEVGQVVRSLIDVQGLVRGAEYEVTGVHVERTIFGSFTTLEVKRGDETRTVGNPHLVLEMAAKIETKKAVPKSKSGFACMECGHKFRTIKAAEKASFGDSGCPKCGGSDIDLDNRSAS